MLEISEKFLCNYEDNIFIDDSDENLTKLWNCDWKSIIGNQDVKNYLSNNLSEDGLSDSLFPTAIAALMSFIQENFTGPPLEESLETILNCKWPESVKAMTLLRVDSEELNPNVKKPELLLLSRNLLNFFHKKEDPSWISELWYIRSLIIHQKVLDDLTNTLYTKFLEASDKVLLKLDEIKDLGLKSLLILEIVQGFFVYRRVTKAERLLTKLLEILEVELVVEGSLGLRTKYQSKPLPQLVLFVKEKNLLNFTPAEVTHKETMLPKLLQLDDDLRLEKYKFLAEEDNFVSEISSIIQSLVLTKVQFIELSQPKDLLADEELAPYITKLLYQDFGPWSTRISALLMNIKLESNHKRTVDRSLKQCEYVMQMIEGKEVPIKQRFSHMFTTGMNPKWIVEARLGDLMLSLGMVKTSLDLYLRLQLWEEVIVCYTMLDLRHKAADIIREQIAVAPTVKLYCLLGDATDDITCYEKAWEFSEFRSGRAQRHWGSYYFAKKEYEEAIPHLQKSLEINSLQEVVWSRLGYAALTLENWEVAAKAYRRYTNLEAHGFESWNNLAKAYIKMGDKVRAHKVLKESLKCNYNNWKVWENFLLVSMDTGNFEDALNAYDRLIEIKGKYFDSEILKILVNSIATNTPDADGVPSARLNKKATKLIGHICVQLPNEGVLWEYAANLCAEPLNRAQKLQKAYRGYTQAQSPWSKNEESCEKVLKLCQELCEVSLEATKDLNEAEKASVVSQLSSARLSAQGSIRAASDEKWEKLNDLVESLKIIFESVTAELKNLMNK